MRSRDDLRPKLRRDVPLLGPELRADDGELPGQHVLGGVPTSAVSIALSVPESPAVRYGGSGRVPLLRAVTRRACAAGGIAEHRIVTVAGDRIAVLVEAIDEIRCSIVPAAEL